MGDTHAKWGLRPTWGMSARLADAVGVRKARELSYTARTFTGKQAAEWGLANNAVPLEKLDETVREITDGIASCSPGSVRGLQRSLCPEFVGLRDCGPGLRDKYRV